MWRLEVPSERGARERGFLHFITVDRAGAAPPPSHRVSGKGLAGAIGSVDGRILAVLFADPKEGGHVALGDGPDLVLIAGLEPGNRYRVTFDKPASCTVQVSPTHDPGGAVATAGGFVRTSAKDCRTP
jgi:hypothetical protein